MNHGWVLEDMQLNQYMDNMDSALGYVTQDQVVSGECITLLTVTRTFQCHLFSEWFQHRHGAK